MFWQFSKENNSLIKQGFIMSTAVNWLGGFVQLLTLISGSVFVQRSASSQMRRWKMHQIWTGHITSNTSPDLPFSSTSSWFSMMPFLSCWCHPLVFIFNIVFVLPFSAAVIFRQQLQVVSESSSVVMIYWYLFPQCVVCRLHWVAFVGCALIACSLDYYCCSFVPDFGWRGHWWILIVRGVVWLQS